MRYIIISVFVLGLAGCSGQPVSEPAGPGSIITGRDEQGIRLSDLTGSSRDDGGSLPVNAMLWRASLDILSSIPVDDVDVFGGSIISDWYQPNNRRGERIKIAAFILDRELRSDGIRIIVYVQRKQGDRWIDHGTDIDMGNRLEELILTRAREIRVRTLQDTN